MIPFLLQLPTVSPDAFMQTALGLGGVMLFLERALTFYKSHMREEPIPSRTYATIEAHQKLEKTVSELKGEMSEAFGELREQLQTDRTELDANNEARASRLHARIDPLAIGIAEVRGEVKGLGRTLDRIAAKLEPAQPRD